MFIVVGEDIVMQDSINDKIFKFLLSAYSRDVSLHIRHDRVYFCYVQLHNCTCFY